MTRHTERNHTRPRRDQAAPAADLGERRLRTSSPRRIVLVAEQLCDTADLHAGWRVLDVATGSGNAAIAAARHGCTAVGVDYVPALLERGRAARSRRGARGRAAGRRRRGAARSRTPRSTPSRRSSARCSRPTTPARPPSCSASAGPAARSPWPAGRRTASSASSSAPSAAHVPPPAGLQSPMLWGTEGHLRELFGEGIAWLEVAERTFTWRFALGGGLRHLLPDLVRADAEGLRGARGRRTRRAGERSGRARAPVRPARQRRRDRHPVDLHRSGGERALTGNACNWTCRHVQLHETVRRAPRAAARTRAWRPPAASPPRACPAPQPRGARRSVGTRPAARRSARW